jgi:hypothetical protein
MTALNSATGFSTLANLDSNDLQQIRLSYPVLIAGEFNSPVPKIYNLGPCR